MISIWDHSHAPCLLLILILILSCQIDSAQLPPVSVLAQLWDLRCAAHCRSVLMYQIDQNEHFLQVWLSHPLKYYVDNFPPTVNQRCGCNSEHLRRNRENFLLYPSLSVDSASCNVLVWFSAERMWTSSMQILLSNYWSILALSCASSSRFEESKSFPHVDCMASVSLTILEVLPPLLENGDWDWRLKATNTTQRVTCVCSETEVNPVGLECLRNKFPSNFRAFKYPWIFVLWGVFLCLEISNSSGCAQGNLWT